MNIVPDRFALLTAGSRESRAGPFIEMSTGAETSCASCNRLRAVGRARGLIVRFGDESTH